MTDQVSVDPAGPEEQRALRSWVPLWWTQQFGVVAQFGDGYHVAWIGPLISELPADAVELRPASPPPATTEAEPDEAADELLVKTVIAASGGQAWLDGPTDHALTARIVINALRASLDARRRQARPSAVPAAPPVPAEARRLSRIAEAHSKNVDSAGGSCGDCVECGWNWPCATYVWATEDRDGLAPWNPADDEEEGPDA